MGVCCAVVGCFNSEREKLSEKPECLKRAFFRFPKNKKLCRQWIIAAGREDLESKNVEVLHKNYRICDIHFELSLRLTKKLKSNAVPTLHLPNISEKTLHSTKSTQTETDGDLTNSEPSTQPSTSGLVSNDITIINYLLAQSDTRKNNYLLAQSDTRKRKLSSTSLNSNELESKRIKTVKHIPQESESEFVVAQKRIECIHNRLRELNPGELLIDNDDYKKYIMNLYFASPLAYSFLYKTLKLPDEKNLRDTSIDIDTKLSDSMIRCLEYKCNRLTKSGKVCVISVGTMRLKSEISVNPHRREDSNSHIGFHEINGKQAQDVANHVVVVMARGLFSKWTQPIAFCFQKLLINYTEVGVWVDKIVMQLIVIGFDIAAITTDSGPIFFCMSRNRNVQHISNDYKIYYIFDVPETLNLLRNELTKNRIYFPDKDITGLCASWDDIQNLFDLEKSKSCRIAYKLTLAHIKPQAFEKATVRFAAQVFSRSVAVAIQYNIGEGKLTNKALGTAVFARQLNDLFDILNSSPKSYETSCKYKKRFSGERYQTDYLQDFLQMLNYLRIVNKANKDVTPLVRCLNDFKTTISSVLFLSVYLKAKGFHYFYTQRLNTDVLKEFFNTLRQNEGHCRVPTPREVCVEFKKNFLKAAIDTQRINIASEINILFSAIDDVYKEIQIKKNVTNFKPNQIKVSKEGHKKLVAIRSNEDIISNQSEESESENEEENDFLEIRSNQSTKEENEYKAIKLEESAAKDTGFSENDTSQSKEVENESLEIETNKNEEEECDFTGSKTNPIKKEDNELQALNDEIEYIFKGKLGEQSTSTYSGIKLEKLEED